MFKRFQRLGGHQDVLRVSVCIIAIHFPNKTSAPIGSYFSVAVDRKGKVKSTTFKNVIEGPDSAQVNFNEVLEFSATLYKDSSGKTLSKVCEISLRQRQREFVTIEFGKIKIDLKDIILESTPPRLNIIVQRNGVNTSASMEITVGVSGYGVDNIPDDLSSVLSDLPSTMSDVSSCISGPTSPSSSQRYRHLSASIRPSSYSAGSISSQRSPDTAFRVNLERAIVEKDNAQKLHTDSLVDIDRLYARIDQLNDLIARQTGDIKLFDDSEKTSNEKVCRLVAERDTLNQQNQQALIQLQEAQANISRLHQDHEVERLNAEAIRQDLSSENFNLKKQLLDALALKAEAEANVERLGKTIGVKHQKIAQAERETEIKESECKAWQEKYKDLGSKLGVSKLQDSLARKEEELAAITVAKGKLEVELASWKRTRVFHISFTCIVVAVFVTYIASLFS